MAAANNKKKHHSGIWIWLIVLAVIIIAIVIAAVFAKGSSDTITDHSTMLSMVNGTVPGERITNIHIEENSTQIIVKGIYADTAGTLHKFEFDGLSKNALEYTKWGQPLYDAITSAGAFSGFSGISPDQGAEIAATVVPVVVMIIIYVLLFWMMGRMMGGGAGGGQNGIFGMTKNKAQLTKSDVKFSDVAGIKEVKVEVEEVVDYLKDPTKYKDAGARAPKGILLEGPPGTGKTLIAKAVAGEAGVNFLSVSGSEFDEMFVGLGASRVRDLFNDAKKNAPCIIFMDEIDAVGRKRTASVSGTNDQTLNQLLVEMDGFNTNGGVIVMAATNRSDVLDPALMRPGRFDRVIKVGLPDIKEREEILKLHAKNKKVDKTIDWYRVAQRTPGFSGAQLANVLNEAAILTIRLKHDEINIQDIDEAIDRVVAGPAKASKVMSKKDKEIVSYHESGHALIGLKVEHASKVQKVTIIPRGDAGGYTIMTPDEEESNFQTRADLVAAITGYMGGRAAEAIIFGENNVTTGAHDDLDKATRIARSMILQLGMSGTVGMVRWLSDEDLSYGRSDGSYSQATAAKIDAEVEKVLNEAYANAKKVIKANMKELKLLAESLRVLETITAEQTEYIDKNLKLPEEVIKTKAEHDEEAQKIKKGDIIDIDLDDAEKSEEKATDDKQETAKADDKKPSSTKKTTSKATDAKSKTKKTTSTKKKSSTKTKKDDKKDSDKSKDESDTKNKK